MRACISGETSCAVLVTLLGLPVATSLLMHSGSKDLRTYGTFAVNLVRRSFDALRLLRMTSLLNVQNNGLLS